MGHPEHQGEGPRPGKAHLGRLFRGRNRETRRIVEPGSGEQPQQDEPDDEGHTTSAAEREGEDERGHTPIKASGTLIRTVWAVSLPIIFLEVSEALVHVTDTAFLARVGTTEVAALALADTILESWIVLIAGLVGAMLIFLGRRLGQGQDRAVGQTFHTGLLLVVLTSLVLTVTLKLGSPLLIEYVDASHDVGTAVDAYVQIAAYGIIFLSLDLAFAALYIALGNTRVLVAASAVLVLTNLVLSYVLIFGALGLPRMGIEGAALAELGAEASTFIFLTVYTLRRRDLGRYGLFRLERWSRNLARSLLRTSLPISLQALLGGLQWFFFFVIVAEIGTEALAWSNIIYACYEVLLIPTMAFGVAAFSMVSNLIGEDPAQDEDEPTWAAAEASEDCQEGSVGRQARRMVDLQSLSDRIGRLTRALILSAYLMTLPIWVLGMLFPDLVLSVFTSDQATIEGAIPGLRIVLLSMLIVVPAEMWVAAVAGTGDTDAALVIELFLTVAMLAVAYVAVFVILTASLTFVWLALPAADLVCLSLSYAWVKTGYWQRRQI